MLTISLILLPLAVSFLLFFIKEKKITQQIALLVTLAELVIAIMAFTGFNKTLGINYPSITNWLPQMGIKISLGMDGISLLLVMLTAVLTPFIILTTFNRENKLPASFYALVLMMEAALIGVFTSQDGLLFYIFWELALIPIYFICGLWGGENKVRITLKFFIYTMAGSLFMLTALIWLYTETPFPHQFGIKNLQLIIPTLSPVKQAWLFAAFFLAFAIKMPTFPFHSWQPDTYTVAPPAGSMLLAGIMLKMGIYGLLRFVLPFGSNILSAYGPAVIVLALIGLIYASVIAIRQQEIKRLIAYSSFAHVGLMAAAVFALTRDALTGTVFQMLSHGVNIVALFFVADIIQKRTQTTQISELGGIAKQAPRFAVFFMVALLGSVALPLTNGFIGEFLMLVGLAQYSMIVAAVAGISIILGAVYMFWLYQRTMYGETKPASASFADLSTIEMTVAVPLIVLIVVMGVFPKPLLEVAQPAITEILKNIHP